MKELTYLLVLPAGAVITIQALINARLGHLLGNTMHAVLVSFTIGTVGAALYCLIEGGSVASLDSLRGAPWWVWTGGLLGAGSSGVPPSPCPGSACRSCSRSSSPARWPPRLALEHFGLLGRRPSRSRRPASAACCSSSSGPWSSA